ncbi:TIGR00266 family protein [Dendrosporobacter sp. 1207_IL3150]|uniref:TIGR00266 family protein n=1 Tax=Dendrosporobacter sp. 1207_IL3150 TaxID=3084054 RepID=UPI002FDA972F
MQWYLSYDGKQVGPLDEVQAREYCRQNLNGLAWREGFSEWVPIVRIAELSGSEGGVMPPPLVRHSISSRKADEVDYKIYGSEMQFVEVELDPGESVIAEAGAMMYKESYISMDTIFGDGSKNTGGGFINKLMGAGKRLLTGESLFMTVFTHQGKDKAKVAFAAPYPGNIVPVNLLDIGGSIICQKDSFLCAAKGVSVSIFFQRKIMTGLFGGEGFIMQKLEGDGMAFLHAGGTIVERKLKTGEVLHADTGCIVCFEPSVDFDIQQAGNIKTALFGGEGMFFATLRGPGKVWLQSMPFSRLAGRMLNAAPQRGGSRGEGSVLGAGVIGGSLLGGIFGDDDGD